MKLPNKKLTGLLAGTVLTFTSFGAYAESHMAEALKHAEAAAKADEGFTGLPTRLNSADLMGLWRL